MVKVANVTQNWTCDKFLSRFGRLETGKPRGSLGGKRSRGIEISALPQGLLTQVSLGHDNNWVAERLNVHPNTVRDYLKAGILSAVKLGRVWRVDKEDLEEFMRPRKTRKNFIRKEDQKEWN